MTSGLTQRAALPPSGHIKDCQAQDIKTATGTLSSMQSPQPQPHLGEVRTALGGLRSIESTELL
jgi:hypothetical protein